MLAGGTAEKKNGGRKVQSVFRRNTVMVLVG